MGQLSSPSFQLRPEGIFLFFDLPTIEVHRVGLLAQSDWNEEKRISRYLNHIKSKRLKLDTTNEKHVKQLINYADADWGGDADDRKSNTGCKCSSFI